MMRQLAALAAVLVLSGCVTVGVGDGPPVINECPGIPEAAFACPDMDDLPTEPIEALQDSYLRTRTAYLDCRAAVGGYRRVLEEARAR